MQTRAADERDTRGALLVTDSVRMQKCGTESSPSQLLIIGDEEIQSIID